MSNILRYSIVFVIGLLAGMLVSLFTLKTGNFYGEEPLQELHQENKIEQNKIDSLIVEEEKIDSGIKKVKKNKVKLHEKFKQDTTTINSIEFDSLVVLFTRAYPSN